MISRPTTPASLLRLPPEIVMFIFQNLSKKDVASFRLTSKFNAACGQESLVKELHLMFRPKSFENLLRIARHPILPKYVRGIFYEAATPHFGMDKVRWLRHVTKSRGLARAFSPEDLVLGWETFSQILREAAVIANRMTDFKTISSAFGQFPNLTTIQMRTDCEATETMLTDYKGALCLPTDEAICVLDPDTKNFRDFDDGTRQLSSVLEATIESGIKLRSLVAKSVDLSFFGIQLMCHCPEEKNTLLNGDGIWTKPFEKRLEPAFHHLHHLDLRFNWLLLYLRHWNDHLSSTRFCDILLGEALKSAKQLRTLALHFAERTNRDLALGTQLCLLKLLGGLESIPVIWPHLTHLELHAIGATTHGWTSFFTAHAPTIQHMILGDLYVDAFQSYEGQEPIPTWIQILTGLREVFRGKDIQFEGWFTTTNSWTIHGRTYQRVVPRDYVNMDKIMPYLRPRVSIESSRLSELADDALKTPRFGDLMHDYFVDALVTRDNSMISMCHGWSLRL